MDIATIFGLVTALAAISGAYVLEGGQLDSVFLISPMLIVIGGTLGATTITTSVQTLRQVPAYLRLAFWGASYSYQETIDLLVQLAEKARREGILGLEVVLPTIPTPTTATLYFLFISRELYQKLLKAENTFLTPQQD